MLLAVIFVLFDSDYSIGREIADLDFFTVVDVFRMLFAIKLFFLDGHDLLAGKITNLDFFTVVNILGMLIAIVFVLFDSDNFLAGKIADLDFLWFPSSVAPDWVTTIFDDCRDKLTAVIEPDERVELIVDKAVLRGELVERVSANSLAAV